VRSRLPAQARQPRLPGATASQPAEALPLIGGVAEVVLNTGVRLEVSRHRVEDMLQRLSGDDPGKAAS